MIHLDPAYVVDLLREAGRGGEEGPATALLDHMADEELGISVPDEVFAATYGRLLAELHRRGEGISTMDLLIATAAIVDEARIVTRDARHFERVPGLHVLSY